MTGSLILETVVHFHRGGRGSLKTIRTGPRPEPPPTLGRLQRVARLMALALRFEEYLRNGKVGDYTELARRGQVSKARISQIMNLLDLAPDIQEQILRLPRITEGRDSLLLCQLQTIASTLHWSRQRRQWGKLKEKGPRRRGPRGSARDRHR